MINNQKIKIYFIGIGGIGMSGIAELMHEIGYTVLGSDKIESENVKRLKKIGINVKIGHNKKNLRKVNAVVFSSAISPKNPEIQEAKKKHIPIVSRADMLSELIIPPFTIVGSNLPDSKIFPTKLVVVVFPCEPATAIHFLFFINSDNISARLTIGICFFLAS